MTNLSFGGWLKRRRNAQGLTQEQLASQINCSLSTLRKIESDERRVSVQMAELFAEIFKIPSSEQKEFLKFARGAWESGSGQYNVEAPWRPSSSHRSNLPSSATSLVGREQEIADLREYLLKADIRLVTLMGPPGVGKTRLSLETAREMSSIFPDGVFFVSLAPLDDPSLIAPAILQSLGYAETINHSASDQVIESIGDKQILLVLDNCEHLMDGAPPLVSRLLSACSCLKILVTSRESVRVSGEWVYSVPPLHIPKEISSIDMETAAQFPALTLFVERARAVRSGFALHADNIQIIASICVQLDGLPLAIELIATRIRVMSPQALLERLNNQFVLSSNGMRSDSARQKTLHNAIGWSYAMLPPEEQNLFAHLSVFAGGFTLDAVESIFSQNSTDRPVPDLIASLLDKSLIQRTSDDLGGIRYDMLVTIQHYAHERLIQLGELQNMRLRHLKFFAKMVEQAELNFKSGDQAVWYQRLDHEADNLRSALNCPDGNENSEMRLRLATGLWRYWKSRGQIREGSEHLRRLLDSQPDDPSRQTSAYAGALNAAGSLAYYGADFLFSEQVRKNALEIFRKLEDKVGIANCLNGLGNVAISQANYESARSYYEEGLDIRRELNDRWGVARLLGNLGLLAYFQVDYVRAHHLHLESIALFSELKDEEGIASELNNLGDVARRQGDLSTANDYYEQSAVIARKLKDQWGLAYTLKGLADVAMEQGDISVATSLYQECLILFQKVGDNIAFPYVFEAVASLMLVKYKPLKTALLLGTAVALRKKLNSPMHPPEIADYDKVMSLLRERLDPSSLEMAWSEGYSMTLDQGIKYILIEPM